MALPDIEQHRFHLDLPTDEDSLPDFDNLLGFPCDRLLRSWKWEKEKNDLVTEAFIGTAPAFLNIIQMAEKLKGGKGPVLIYGESGTGKELLAHFIHNLDRQSDSNRPFVTVNCGAIPENLIESELFGHEKGAFTGAVERKMGLFELANCGDIFLDEIGALQPNLQVKLLRVLEDKMIRRIGGKESLRVEFRAIAATNENLEERVEEGLFRLDLYHRLSVFPLTMPSLHERREDIPSLANYFLKKHGEKNTTVRFSSCAMEFFTQYSWPGNIRQLENLIHRLVIYHPQGEITEKHILEILQNNVNGNDKKTASANGNTLKDCLQSSEKEVIEKMLNRHYWNLSRAAKELKVSRTTLYKKIELYKLSRK